MCGRHRGLTTNQRGERAEGQEQEGTPNSQFLKLILGASGDFEVSYSEPLLRFVMILVAKAFILYRFGIFGA
jgi:hypothetical protein